MATTASTDPHLPPPPPPLPIVAPFSALTGELVVCIVQFLCPKEVVRMCHLVSLHLHNLLLRHDELLFQPHVLALRPLVSAASPSDVTNKLGAANKVMRACGLQSWHLFYGALEEVLHVPTLGYFRRVPKDFSTDYKGQLIRVRPLSWEEKETEWKKRLGPDATIPDLCVEIVHPVRFLAHLTLAQVVDETTGALRFERLATSCKPHTLQSFLTGTTEMLEWHVHKGVNEVDAAAIENGVRPCFSLGHYREDPGGNTVIFESDYHTLPLPDPALRLPNDPVLRDLPDLWTGAYGPHGYEILQFRFVQNEAEPGVVLLEGLKIVGDANVPANEWSFRVDISRPLDKVEVLRADTRPIHLLDVGMALTERVLLQEIGKIHKVFAGKGQINMVPGTWAPQEVGVDLVVLKPTNAGEETRSKACWLVWHDLNHVQRHCIDFARLM